MIASADTGRHAQTPAQVPPRGWWQILRRTIREASADNLGLVAAGVSFYAFLALVPLLGALVLTYGLFVDPADAAEHIQALTAALPADAAGIIKDQLSSIVDTAAGKKGLGLALALLLAFYGAMKGAGAIVVALNIVYEEEEKRGFLRSTLVNAAITGGAALLATALVMAGSVTVLVEDWTRGLGPVALLLIKLLSWLVTAALASAAIATLYRYAPSRDAAKWSWLTPGSIAATLGLVAATAAFGFYAARFGDYNATYGALGSVVVLLMWLYISAYVLVLGGELNAELERQTEADTTRGPEKPLGARGAQMADTVAPAAG